MGDPNRIESSTMNQQRRHVLIRSANAVTVAALGLPALGAMARAEDAAAAAVDVHIELRAVRDQVSLRAGAPARVWRYRGKLLRGDAGALEAEAGNYLGPIIRMRRGQRVRIDLINELPKPTIIRWHGLHVPDTMDGHPRFAIAPGERYVYVFRVDNRAGSYWFHPHPHGRTGPQVYAGLAGLFLVSDDEEGALRLPSGAQDVPLIIQDRSFDASNQFVYPVGAAAPHQGRGMMGGGMMGGSGMMGGGTLGQRHRAGGMARPGAGGPTRGRHGVQHRLSEPIGMERRHAAARRTAHRRHRTRRCIEGARPRAVLRGAGPARLSDRHAIPGPARSRRGAPNPTMKEHRWISLHTRCGPARA
jgi:hypothetical protein